MSYQVNITKNAERDLNNAALYIAGTLGSNIAAVRLLDTADEVLSSLSDFPKRNGLVRDTLLAENGIRVQMINNYLAFYVIREETKSVTVLRIINSRRDWASMLRKDILSGS